MTTDPNLDGNPPEGDVMQFGEEWHSQEARDKAWDDYFADPANGWPPNYPEDERKAIEEHGGG